MDALFDRLGGAGARDALAEALCDDSLTLDCRRPHARRYIDAEGHAVDLPGPGSERGVTEIARDGVPVAAIVHDPVLLEDRELVRTARPRRWRSRTSSSTPRCAPATTTCGGQRASRGHGRRRPTAAERDLPSSASSRLG